MSQLVSPDAGGFGLKEIALQSGMYNGDPVHHTFRPFCTVKNVLEVFWGYDARFVAGLIGMVSLAFRSNKTLLCAEATTGIVGTQ